MTTNLGLTDGTTTYNLNSVGGAYELLYDQWKPQVAQRRPTALGGVGLYADVEEEIPLLIRDAASVDAFTHIARLRRLLDQVQTWRDDDTAAAAVKLTYRPNGSAKGSDYECVITEVLGLEVPPRLNDPTNDVIAPVILRVKRAAEWLNETDTQSSSAVGTGALWSVTLADHGEYSPVDVSWTMPTLGPTAPNQYIVDGTGLVLTDGTLLLSDSADWSPAGQWATSTQTTAVGGSVARLTPVAANTFYPLTFGAFSPTVPGQYLFIASLTPTIELTISRTWSLYLEISTRLATISPTPIRTPIVTIATPTAGLNSWARMVILGILSIPEPGHVASYSLNAAINDVATSPSPLLDLDYLVVAQIVPSLTVTTMLSGSVRSTNFGTSAPITADILQRRTTKRTPRFRIRAEGTPDVDTSMSYLGGIETAQKGTTLGGIWIGGNNGTGNYNAGIYRVAQQPPAAAGTLHTTAFTVTRRRAYLTPE